MGWAPRWKAPGGAAGGLLATKPGLRRVSAVTLAQGEGAGFWSRAASLALLLAGSGSCLLEAARFSHRRGPRRFYITEV